MGRGGFNLLRWLSVAMLLAAMALFFFELVSYSRLRARLPQGLSIGGVPVGGLTQQEALERLLQVYSSPVELYYGDELILLQPASVGYQLDSEAMLAAAELKRTETDFWAGFWDFLWGRSPEAEDIPVRSQFSPSQMEAMLRDIAARYDEPPLPPQPVPGMASFTPGQPGRVLDIARAADLISEVLNRPADRRVTLPVVASRPPRPSMEALESLLRQTIVVDGFDGLAVLYVADLRTGEDLHFGLFRGEDFPVQPDVAFTAASIIKIPIMVTYYRFFDEPLDAEADRWMLEMITESGNDPADWLMERLDRFRGPLVVTETMQELGLENTFLAGYFRLGAELLRVYRTPANQRADIDTGPDIYNQTTASDIGMLLVDIYQCADGGGTLLAVFPGQIRPEECARMLDLLSQNKIGILIEAGVPEGTRVAHKHGWTSSPLDMIGDAGIVYSPGGDYVLALFLWNEPDMLYDPTAQLISDLSRAVYNFYNPPAPSKEG